MTAHAKTTICHATGSATNPYVEITVNLLHGPFRKLANRWRFVSRGQGTEGQFEIDFEFKSKLLQTLLAANFHHAVSRLIDCFETRAKALYGAAGG